MVTHYWRDADGDQVPESFCVATQASAGCAPFEAPYKGGSYHGAFYAGEHIQAVVPISRCGCGRSNQQAGFVGLTICWHAVRRPAVLHQLCNQQALHRHHYTQPQARSGAHCCSTQSARSPRPGSTQPAALLQWPGHGGLWRAYLPLDPLANHGAHSYWSSVLRPLATIAQELAPKAAR